MTVQTVAQFLEDVDTLLDTKDKWTYGAFARNRTEEGISPKSEKAVCFCIEGAMQRVAGDDQSLTFIEAFRLLNESSTSLYPGKSLVAVNDNYGYEAIKLIVKKARLQAAMHSI